MHVRGVFYPVWHIVGFEEFTRQREVAWQICGISKGGLKRTEYLCIHPLLRLFSEFIGNVHKHYGIWC